MRDRLPARRVPHRRAGAAGVAAALVLGLLGAAVSMPAAAVRAAAIPSLELGAPGWWPLVPPGPTQPPPAEPPPEALDAVSCLGSFFCMGVGASGPAGATEPLQDLWNGSAWSVTLTHLTPAGSATTLSGVSCVTRTFCVSVGHLTQAGVERTLIEQWDGSQWTPAASPNESTAPNVENRLTGIACTGTAACVAVGRSGPAGATRSFAETWNGAAWSLVSLGPGFPTSLDAVSCASAAFCMAAGTGNVFAAYDGTGFRTVPGPASPPAGAVVAGISCTTAGECVAVGQSTGAHGPAGLIEQWNGTAWSSVPTPVVPGATGGFSLSAVSCAQGTCVAGGGDGYPLVLTSAGGGAWHVSPTPTFLPSAATVHTYLSDGALVGVSCAVRSCVTVGSFVGIPASPGTPLSMVAQFTPPGYTMAAADGGIFTFGGAGYFGSMGGTSLNEPVVGLAETLDGQGYWEVASDGGIFAFGDAAFAGSMGGRPLNRPIVGMAADPATGGYWEVASDGGIFAFHAPFLGSMGGTPLNKPIVGMAPTPDGAGYWEVASDGGVFAFGDATFFGSMGGHPLNQPIVGMAVGAFGQNVWLVASDGGIFTFPSTCGSACGSYPTFFGSIGGHRLNQPVVGMAAAPGFGGYWEVASDGGLFAFGDAAFAGSMGGRPLNSPVVAVAS